MPTFARTKHQDRSLPDTIRRMLGGGGFRTDFTRRGDFAYRYNGLQLKK